MKSSRASGPDCSRMLKARSPWHPACLGVASRNLCQDSHRRGCSLESKNSWPVSVVWIWDFQKNVFYHWLPKSLRCLQHLTAELEDSGGSCHKAMLVPWKEEYPTSGHLQSCENSHSTVTCRTLRIGQDLEYCVLAVTQISGLAANRMQRRRRDLW
jgi:hypothetical protein